MITATKSQAMLLALELALSEGAPIHGPNPRVGCVILSGDGHIVGEGFHRGPGTAHAEVDALAEAGKLAKGGTAVVTLEPCNHTGRTGPCTKALIKAGIREVVFAQTDPNPDAAGGAAFLRAAGVEVEGGLYEAQAAAINSTWSHAVRSGRPFVTLKLATTLDGRIAAADGTSRWISSPQAREQVHELRSRVDAVVVGTGTVLRDDPDLTDRRGGVTHQPVRVVIGQRAIPADAKLLQPGGNTIIIPTHDISKALGQLYDSGVRQVLVEGGATIAAAFVRAGLVDVLLWYVSPMLLGAGRSAIDDLGIESIDGALRWEVRSVIQVGDDVRLEMVPQAPDDSLPDDSQPGDQEMLEGF